jgi:hypothetical protein
MTEAYLIVVPVLAVLAAYGYYYSPKFRKTVDFAWLVFSTLWSTTVDLVRAKTTRAAAKLRGINHPGRVMRPPQPKRVGQRTTLFQHKRTIRMPFQEPPPQPTGDPERRANKE